MTDTARTARRTARRIAKIARLTAQVTRLRAEILLAATPPAAAKLADQLATTTTELARLQAIQSQPWHATRAA